MLEIRTDSDLIGTLAENLPVLAWAAKPDGTVYWYNKRWLEYTGFTLDEMLAAGWGITHDPQMLPFVEREWAYSLENKTKFEMTFPIRGADGQFRPFFTSAVPVFHEDGSVKFWAGTNTDVTDQFVYQHDLKQSEEYNRAIVESSVDGIVIINTKGVIQSFNPAACQMFGWSREEAIGMNISSFMPDELGARHGAILANYEKTRVKHIIGMGNINVNGKKRDGTLFPIELAVSEWGNEGHRFFTGTIRDITEQVKAEEDLRNLNDQLEERAAERAKELDMIFQLSGDALGTAGNDRFTAVSPAMSRILGYSREELNSLSLTSLIHPGDLDMTLERFAHLAPGETVFGFENRMIAKSGELKWMSWTVTPDNANGRLFFVARDITLDKLRDDELRQAQKMDAVGQLTGGIAHDFNNLLQIVHGNLELLTMRISAEDERAEKYIKNAISGAKKAAALTARLLAFSRRQQLNPVIVEPNKLIADMSELASRTTGPNIELELNLHNEACSIKCDPNQLESSLLNLIINARDAIGDRPDGKICIATENTDMGVCISVHDNGAGMSEEVMQKAFEPFFTTKPIGQGTGLGLSMLHGFVMQSGGKVKIESEESKGSKVCIYLPAIASCKVDQHEEEEDLPIDIPDIKMTLMVVEDEIFIRQMVVDALEDSGFIILEAGDCDEALKIIGENPQIDMLLTDVGLPGLNGRQLVEIVRQDRPDLPVLFMTGYAAGILERDQIVKDKMDLIQKPFAIGLLVAKINEMMHVD